MNRPTPPSYRSFGLTEAEFEQLAGLYDRIFPYLLWPSLSLWLLFLFASEEDTVTKVLVAPVSCVIVAVLAAAVAGMLARIRQWIHPKWPNLRNYRKAGAEYQEALAAWTQAQAMYWRRLDGRTFEIVLGRLYQQLGYSVSLTRTTGDEGIDLVLRERESKVIVQCKAHAKPVGPGPVRELYGALLHSGAQKAILASTGGFSSGARKFAEGKPIELLDLYGIVSLAEKAYLQKKG